WKLTTSAIPTPKFSRSRKRETVTVTVTIYAPGHPIRCVERCAGDSCPRAAGAGCSALDPRAVQPVGEQRRCSGGRGSRQSLRICVRAGGRGRVGDRERGGGRRVPPPGYRQRVDAGP